MSKRDSKKLRANTAWEYNLEAKSRYRPRTSTGGDANEIQTSPRRSTNKINISGSMTTRASNKTKLPKFMFHSHAYSVFSSTGMDAMLDKLSRQSVVSNASSKAMSPRSPKVNGHHNGSNGHHGSIHNGNTGNNSSNSLFGIRRLDSIQRLNTSLGNIVTKPTQTNKLEYEQAIREWESEGEWIEARETITGRIMWYNTNSLRLVFDTPPDGIRPLPPSKYTKELGPKKDEYFLTRPLTPYETEDVVQGLLNFNSHDWDFDNDLVNVYRAQSIKRDHKMMLPEPRQYVFPEYFSESPLPELAGGKFLAKIRLPEIFSKHRRYATIQIKVDYTKANDAIKQGVEKLDAEHVADVKDFILKVVGQEAYMYGRRKIIDYEAVRTAVRNENDVEFVLIKRPDFDDKVNEAEHKQIEYTQKFDKAYPKELYEDLESYLEYETMANNGKIPSLDDNDDIIDGDIDNDFTPKNVISLYECEWHYRLKIEGLTNVINLPRFEESTMKQVYCVAELWMGDLMFEHAQLLTTNQKPKSEIRWGQWISSRNVTFSQIPREAVICFMVMGICADNSHECLAWARMPLIDHRHRLRKGKYLLNMWEIPRFVLKKDGPKTDPYKDRPFRYRGSTRDKNIKHIEMETQCQLLVEFDTFAFEVIAPILPPKIEYNNNITGNKLEASQLSKQYKTIINNIIEKSPLEILDHKEKDLIWQSRDLLWHDPKALPAFLKSVNWTNRVMIAEAHKYIKMWSPPKRVEEAIEFLDYRFSDTFVRMTAIKWLQDMNDSDLQQYLLQLVQCLKYESHHDSILSKFLIKRGLKNPYQIGHFLFWHLKSEYHDIMYSERFGLIMEEYLLHACQHSTELFVQNSVLKRLEMTAEKVQTAKRSGQKKDYVKRLLKKELIRLNKDLPDTIQIPLNPRWSAKKIFIEKCRFMSSKKVPLWLVFENNDPYAPPIEIMFKSGDDLRQDMLTLQVLKVMDRLWLDNKLDLHLKPYNVLATGVNRRGLGVGMLELVLNSETVNSINMANGGAFNEQTIDKFIRKYNTYEQTLKRARDSFARSCAGYCIATCVLGIGDRHSDNYMVTKSGQFFHIDFGHFLGNFKSKAGIKRERTPFVFTIQMKYAIDAGNKNNQLYDQFQLWCCEAYNVLRTRSRLLLVLFILMVSAGMPELMKEDDIKYFKNMLRLKYDVKKADEHINKQIKLAVSDKSRLIDMAIHGYVHKK